MSKEKEDTPSKKLKTQKSEIVSIRLEPKLRYLAEIAARKHRRTLSSYIEWAIAKSLANVVFDSDPDAEQLTVADLADELWDVDEPDRFVALAFRFPDLLTHDEQVLWKLIRESNAFWLGHHKPGAFKWTVAPNSIVLDRVRTYWDVLHDVANGRRPKTDLPQGEAT